jgi:predicted neuraminidase
MESTFIYDSAPFRSAHAVTLAEGKHGLVAAWFGGRAEGWPDVAIWVARHDGGRWQPPEKLVDGRVSRLRRYPCWNPVLHQVPGGPLMLFYKVGPRPSRWWGMLMRSDDGGKTFSKPERLPAGILGPIKNKPVNGANGDLLCPSSVEDDGWRVHVEHTRDFGVTWRRSPPLNERKTMKAIQPTLLPFADGRMQLLCRTRQGSIGEAWSIDHGRTWSPVWLTALPNPDSAIDAVVMADGRALLVYNHTTTGRTPLTLALSSTGERWRVLRNLESDPGEFSYPAVIQTRDNRIHIAYTHNRTNLRHVTLDPAELA